MNIDSILAERLFCVVLVGLEFCVGLVEEFGYVFSFIDFLHKGAEVPGEVSGAGVAQMVAVVEGCLVGEEFVPFFQDIEIIVFQLILLAVFH